jgi:hypothetical protein
VRNRHQQKLENKHTRDETGKGHFDGIKSTGQLHPPLEQKRRVSSSKFYLAFVEKLLKQKQNQLL